MINENVIVNDTGNYRNLRVVNLKNEKLYDLKVNPKYVEIKKPTFDFFAISEFTKKEKKLPEIKIEFDKNKTDLRTRVTNSKVVDVYYTQNAATVSDVITTKTKKYEDGFKFLKINNLTSTYEEKDGYVYSILYTDPEKYLKALNFDDDNEKLNLTAEKTDKRMDDVINALLTYKRSLEKDKIEIQLNPVSKKIMVLYEIIVRNDDSKEKISDFKKLEVVNSFLKKLKDVFNKLLRIMVGKQINKDIVKKTIIYVSKMLTKKNKYTVTISGKNLNEALIKISDIGFRFANMKNDGHRKNHDSRKSLLEFLKEYDYINFNRENEYLLKKSEEFRINLIYGTILSINEITIPDLYKQKVRTNSAFRAMDDDQLISFIKFRSLLGYSQSSKSIFDKRLKLFLNTQRDLDFKEIHKYWGELVVLSNIRRIFKKNFRLALPLIEDIVWTCKKEVIIHYSNKTLVFEKDERDAIIRKKREDLKKTVVETLYDEDVKFVFFSLNEMSNIVEEPAYKKISSSLNRGKIGRGNIPKIRLGEKSVLNNENQNNDKNEDDENNDDENENDENENEEKGEGMDIDENSTLVQKLDKAEEQIKSQFDNISYANDDDEKQNKRETALEYEKISKLVKDAESLMDNNIVVDYVELIKKIYTNNENLYSYIVTMENQCSSLDFREGFEEHNVEIADNLSVLEVYRNLRYLFHLPETFSIYYTGELIKSIGNKPTLAVFYRCYILTITELFFASRDEFDAEKSLGEWTELVDKINLNPIKSLFNTIKSNQNLVEENYNTFSFTYFKLLLYILNKITEDVTFKTLYAFFAGGIAYIKPKVISEIGDEVPFNIFMIKDYMDVFLLVENEMNRLMQEGFNKNSKVN